MWAEYMVVLLVYHIRKTVSDRSFVLANTVFLISFYDNNN